jgi:hypothetical protein
MNPPRNILEGTMTWIDVDLKSPDYARMLGRPWVERVAYLIENDDRLNDQEREREDERS